jgi:hypothetical protein
MPGEQVHGFLAQMTCPAFLVMEHVEQCHIASSKDPHVLAAARPDVDIHPHMGPAFPPVGGQRSALLRHQVLRLVDALDHFKPGLGEVAIVVERRAIPSSGRRARIASSNSTMPVAASPTALTRSPG